MAKYYLGQSDTSYINISTQAARAQNIVNFILTFKKPTYFSQ